MTKSTGGRDWNAKDGAFPLIDPRQGDVEDDAASPGQRSLLAIAGSLLVEISLPKLLFAWTVSLLLPAVLLGPLSGWLASRTSWGGDGCSLFARLVNITKGRKEA